MRAALGDARYGKQQQAQTRSDLMRAKSATTIAALGSFLLVMSDTAFSQVSKTQSGPHPSIDSLYQSMSSWFSSHRGAALILALAVVVGLGMAVMKLYGSRS